MALRSDIREGVEEDMRGEVVDENNVIRYADFVPGGGLPDINRALKEARKVLNKKKL